MDIGINYLTELEEPKNRFDKLYKILLKSRYINTIKFPGKYCDFETLDNFLKLINETGAKPDIHGLPGMVAAIHSKNFVRNVDWEKVKERISECKRISTHIGLENKDRMENYEQGVFENNIKQLKQNLNCEVGIENIPGGFDFDHRTLTPEFITEIWGKADFGVYDISHAKLSAKDLGISYEEFVERLGNKEKVKILHVSGNIDDTGKYEYKPDKHVLINEKEISDVIKLFEQFKNVDLVVSEYAYNTKYSYEKEIVIEVMILNEIIKTKNEQEIRNKLKFLQENLENNLSNLEEIIVLNY